jgi:hypothetical protein
MYLCSYCPRLFPDVGAIRSNRSAHRASDRFVKVATGESRTIPAVVSQITFNFISAKTRDGVKVKKAFTEFVQCVM